MAAAKLAPLLLLLAQGARTKRAGLVQGSNAAALLAGDIERGAGRGPSPRLRNASTPGALQRCVEACHERSKSLEFSPREFVVEAVARGYSSSKYGFPTGMASLAEVIRHELRFVPKITKEMVYRGWCIGPDPFQSVVGWQMANGLPVRETHRFGDMFENRVLNTITLLRQAAERLRSGVAGAIGDVDMVVYTADLPPDLERGRISRDRGCWEIHPFFVHQKQVADDNPSSIVFPEPRFVDWPADRPSVMAAGDQPWKGRTGKLLFRGNDQGYRAALDKGWLMTNFNLSFDLMKVDVADQAGRLNREQQCAFKYQLYLPGFWGTISYRLRFLLACGSVVIMPKHDWYEFYYPLLVPYKHFIPAGNLQLTRGHDMPCIVDCLKEHDDEAKEIGENARRFVEDWLPADAAEKFIVDLWEQYSKRMAYDAGQFEARDPNPNTCRCTKPGPAAEG